jgi:2-polyprenyl-3-methyl-5-hydroxy-6-metoxy-1,4-benzoquinol methylase
MLPPWGDPTLVSVCSTVQLSQELPNGVPTYDCVLALDVIEHLDDDRHAVQQLGRLLSPTAS